MTARYDILIPMSEVARMAGLSRQRIYQLVQREGTMPKPVMAEQGFYRKRLWSKKAIQKWVRSRSRG